MAQMSPGSLKGKKRNQKFNTENPNNKKTRGEGNDPSTLVKQTGKSDLNALETLMSEYANEDEAPTEIPFDAAPIKEQQQLPPAVNAGLPPPRKTSKKPCQFFRKGFCKHGKHCKFSHEKVERNPTKKSAIGNKPSLYEKLFSKEISEDKTVILECLRYMVAHKFFIEQPNL